MSVLNLDALFRPKSVALVGASQKPGHVGSVVMKNLLAGGFQGPILPVHPEYGAVEGVEAYRSLAKLPRVPDLAVLCTPPRTIPGLIAELAEMGTRAAIVLTAWRSSERDREGCRLDEAMLESIGGRGMRILGPNCVGLLAPHVGLNASFAQRGAPKGRTAFVSQSGALCTAVLGWASARELGFSAFVSLGDSKDVDVGDVVDFLGSDPHTRAILLYLESLSDAREFLSATRAASRNKPVVAIKAGRVPEGEAAAASHTGALAGSDDVYDYALRRAGVLRVGSIDELFDAVETIERLTPEVGDALTILTNGGGPGVMATDALVSGGGRLAQLSDETLRKLDAVLPPTWSRRNPIDIIGDAGTERYQQAIRVLASAPEVHSLLVIHAPTATVDSESAARAVIEASGRLRTKMLACWLGGESSSNARRVFTRAGAATYDTPEDAVRAFLHMSEYRRSRELLMQTPPSVPVEIRGDAALAREVIDRELDGEAVWLDEVESKEILQAYGIPVVRTRRARDAEEAAALAEEIGFPVALKILSPDVLHKTDVGGVALDLETSASLLEAADAMVARLAKLEPRARLEGFTVQAMARRPGAYELIVGASVDPVFGPFVMFGHGGTGVEVLDDTAVALPPLNMLLAEELVARTRISRLLRGFRGRPSVSHEDLYLLLIRVSHLISELPEIVELDINPVLADERGVVALDARMRLHRTGIRGPERLAIRPYPAELEERVVLPSGRSALIRPIRPEDEPTHRRLFSTFTSADIRFRFFHLVRKLPHSELARYTQIDYDREMAFIAIEQSERRPEELGVVRAVSDPDNIEAEFAIIVSPRVKGEGLGRLLLEKIVRYARGRGTRVIVGHVLIDNLPMLSLARSLGFEETRDLRNGEVEIRLELAGDGPERARRAEPASRASP